MTRPNNSARRDVNAKQHGVPCPYKYLDEATRARADVQTMRMLKSTLHGANDTAVTAEYACLPW